MREKLIVTWRKITKIKILYPFIIFIRYFAATNFFNTILDFLEVNIFQTSYSKTVEFASSNKERIKIIQRSLADERSRQVYGNIWKYRMTHKRRYLKKIVDKEQYFDHELVKLGNKEVFVDCGAYKGDTIRDFYKHLPSGKKYDFITAFEPDEYNYKKLQEYIQKKEDVSKVQCYQLGTWNEKTKLRFRSNTEEGCMVTNDGDVEISADTIDRILGKRKVTYIKMDVEGAELKSLMGAEQVIEREHPRLAISIYHSDEDMVDIIEYIKEKYPFYKLYIRHYTWFYADTVMYAIDLDKKY